MPSIMPSATKQAKAMSNEDTGDVGLSCSRTAKQRKSSIVEIIYVRFWR